MAKSVIVRNSSHAVEILLFVFAVTFRISVKIFIMRCYK